MGQPTPPAPALLITAVFSRYDEAFAWARQKLESAWGPVLQESPLFDFIETDYYQPTMGTGIRKQFWTFAMPFDPARLVEVKLLANSWEKEYAASAGAPEPRPLNIDPGYLTLGKLVLASTKDFAHRIYLNQGIYAEVTLFYKQHRWRHHEYTFADYRRDDYQQFFTRCRDWLHVRLKMEWREQAEQTRATIDKP
jgi:hypothetical protein